MLDKIITGRRTGAEQAALRVASAFGIAHDAGTPLGLLTEEGTQRESSEYEGAPDLTADEDASRIEQSVRDSDATLWFGETTTANAQVTVSACRRFGKSCMPVYPGASFEPAHIVTWIEHNAVRTLYVTGNREREEPGINDRVERFLGQVLEALSDESS
jgi:hypothetical protein